jgi:hypothetical protein
LKIAQQFTAGIKIKRGIESGNRTAEKARQFTV